MILVDTNISFVINNGSVKSSQPEKITGRKIMTASSAQKNLNTGSVFVRIKLSPEKKLLNTIIIQKY